ncbi:MAG: TOBE domain-containing protein [Actinomycetota bacterium]
METSARNQLRGTVKSVTIGAVMAEVVMDVSGVEVVAAITKDSAERLSLSQGIQAVAVIKATDVMIGIE